MDVLGSVLWIPVPPLRDDDALFRAVRVSCSPACYLAPAVPTTTKPLEGRLRVSALCSPHTSTCHLDRYLGGSLLEFSEI